MQWDSCADLDLAKEYLDFFFSKHAGEMALYLRRKQAKQNRKVKIRIGSILHDTEFLQKLFCPSEKPSYTLLYLCLEFRLGD